MQPQSISRIKPSFKRSLLAFAVANVLNVSQASAATIQVTSASDGSGIPDGLPVDLFCTLREAVTSINTGSLQPGCLNSNGEPFGTNDRINSAPAADIKLDRGSLIISKNVTIDLAGRLVETVYDSSVFEVADTSLTLENGSLSGATGSNPAIRANNSELTLNTVGVDENAAQGILAENTQVTLNNSGFFSNGAQGIKVTGGELILNNSTISENDGVGIDANTATVVMNNATVAANGKGNLMAINSPAFLNNSLLADAPTGYFDCVASAGILPVVLGGNGSSIIADGSCNAKILGARIGDPNLGRSEPDGNPGSFLALSVGSSARNAGNDNCLATDQRGQTRPTSGCDIGAFEFGQMEIEVDSLRDDGTGCTLREAIAANTTGGCSPRQPLPTFVDGTRVVFSPNLQNSTITLNGQRLFIDGNDNVEIDASAINGIRIDANRQSRVVYVRDSDVLINQLTLSRGYADAEEGGGGLFGQRSNVFLVDSHIDDNATAYSGGGLSFRGRGVFHIESSTISNNNAQESGGGISFFGDGNSLLLINATLSANSAVTGGGVYATLQTDVIGADVSVMNSTLANNAAATGGSGLHASASSTKPFNLEVSNTIIAGSSGAKACFVDESVTSGDNDVRGNIVQDGSCGWLKLNPILLPLEDNGGPTLTHALAENSPARKLGVLSECTDSDQRGFTRTAEDGLCDAGAFEFQNSDAPVNFYVIPIPGRKSVVIPL